MTASSQLENKYTMTQRHLNTLAAIAMVQRCVELTTAQGFNAAATVVDRAGVVLAVARANDAGAATLDGSRRKAYTAINLGMSSDAAEHLVRDNVSLRALGDIEQLLPLQGGVLIKIEDRIVGAIGVGGASGAIDEKTALQAIEEVLAR